SYCTRCGASSGMSNAQRPVVRRATSGLRLIGWLFVICAGFFVLLVGLGMLVNRRSALPAYDKSISSTHLASSTPEDYAALEKKLLGGSHARYLESLKQPA